MIHYGPARTDEDLHAILSLQQENLPKAISVEEAREQGFVTVEHDFALLREMNDHFPHAIARDGDVLAGYALAMLPLFGDRIPVLRSLFARLDQLEWEGVPLHALRYCVMGQVCVARPYRGQGVFAGVYEDLGRRMAPHFDLLVTEIATRNTRSLRAHEKIGLVEMERFSEAGGADWVIVGWPLETFRP
jgi:hypothetical protein